MTYYEYQIYRKKDRQRLKYFHIVYQNEDPTQIILEFLLDELRNQRYNQLTEKYDPSEDYTLKDFVPAYYRQYANDASTLKQHLATLNEVKLLYNIEIIGKAPDCYGCRLDKPGQNSHMECNTGCLHNATACGCSNNT